MTLIETHEVIFGRDGQARVPSAAEHVRRCEIRSRPSGVSAFRCALPSRTERALMGSIGRPWV